MGVTRQLDISADFTGAMSGNIVARQLAGQASGRECYGGVSAPGYDALETLLIRHPLNLEQVREVRVRLAPSLQGPINNSQSPDLCLQHLVAVMLIDKTVSFQAAHDGGRMQDPTILKLRSKVILISDEEFEQRLPQWEATVELLLNDGTHLTQHVEDPRGTLENPMTRDEVASKARSLMEGILLYTIYPAWRRTIWLLGQRSTVIDDSWREQATSYPN